MATRAAAVNPPLPTSTNPLSRNRSSSATNPSGITSPFSPPSLNSNHIDHSGQSMSPPSISQSMPNTAIRTNPPTATKFGTSDTNLDTSTTVKIR